MFSETGYVLHIQRSNKINRGWPIGLTDCNYDHIQWFIKITNMMEKSPLKKLVHTCRGRVIKAILVFIITYKCQEIFIILHALVNKKIINFSLSLIKISMHNLFLMDFFFHRNGQIFKIVDKLI